MGSSECHSTSLAVVIANLPKSLPNKPSLWKFSDLDTIFHEFGHAMHAILGSSEFTMNSGFNTKIDFVETPS